jgi:hypothetical protein
VAALYRIALPSPLKGASSRKALAEENARLRYIAGLAGLELEKNHAQMVLMDRENKRLRKQLFAKKTKKKRTYMTNQARLLTGEEMLASLLHDEQAKKLKPVHKEMKKGFRLINKMLTQTGSIFESPDVNAPNPPGRGWGRGRGRGGRPRGRGAARGAGRGRREDTNNGNAQNPAAVHGRGGGRRAARGRGKGKGRGRGRAQDSESDAETDGEEALSCPLSEPSEGESSGDESSHARKVLREISPAFSLAAPVTQTRGTRVQRRLRLSGSTVTAGCEGTWSSR